MHNRSRVSAISYLLWTLIFAVIIGITFGACQNIPTEKLKYDGLISQIARGNVASITIYTGGKIEGSFVTAVNHETKFISYVNENLITDLKSKMDASPNPPQVDYAPSPGDSSLLMMLLSWLPMLAIAVVFIYFMRRQSGQGVNSFGKSKAKLSSDSTKKKITFADIAGQSEAQEELRELVDFLKKPAEFHKLGARIPKGVLLMGPPGVGKTLLARAVAGEADVPFFSTSGSDFVELFVGVGASRVRDLFEQGKKNAPCIIFIDEVDAVGRQRGAGLGGGHDEKEQTLNQLLSEMDGFDSNEGIITIAATNRPDVLDPALLRPGRFDRQVVLGKPDIKGREEILKIHSRKIKLEDNVELSKIARGTAGFSGADLASLINEAILNAGRNNRKSITNTDLEFAKDKLLMGGERRSMIISDNEKMTTAIHEAGHALIAILLKNKGADPLHKVTIVPRGMALGLTQQLPLEDKHNYSKEYLTTQMEILMGGKCAELVLLGQETTGASNDIGRATELAQHMVCEWGMSGLGPQKFGSREENPFLGKSIAERARDCSERTAEKIDDEVKKLLDNAYEGAREKVTQYENTIRKIAVELLNRETLDGDELTKIAGL